MEIIFDGWCNETLTTFYGNTRIALPSGLFVLACLTLAELFEIEGKIIQIPEISI